jgi:N-acetylmuramoyl-L-alanine amidase
LKKSVLLFLTFVLLLLFSIFPILHATEKSKVYTIYLDPGHGGFDGGAISKYTEVKEADINLEICRYLESYLEKSGFCVLLTRTKDVSLASEKRDDILKRVDLINQEKPAFYLSIHTNSFPDPTVAGAQCFYSNQCSESSLLASIIQDKIRSITPSNRRVAKSIQNKYLIDYVLVPGCLVEVGFITNPDEASLITSKEGQMEIALAIYSGCLEYIDYQK